MARLCKLTFRNLRFLLLAASIPSLALTICASVAYGFQLGESPSKSSPAQGGSPGQGQPAQPQSKAADARRVDLAKFVGAATTPVGLIIAGAITISFFEQKRIDATGRVRSLIAELRDPQCGQARRKSLVDQIELYKGRLSAIHRGSLLIGLTIILFIVTDLSVSLGLIWPAEKSFEFLVIVSMFTGMLTLAVGIAADLFDSRRNHHELNIELADFDRIAGSKRPNT